MAQSGKWIAAICAAPIAFGAAKVNLGSKITSHPSVKSQLDSLYSYHEDRVVLDGKMITSRGPATSFEFALAIIKELCGSQVAENVMKPMIFH